MYMVQESHSVIVDNVRNFDYLEIGAFAKYSLEMSFIQGDKKIMHNIL
jgi:hypothetical protein